MAQPTDLTDRLPKSDDTRPTGKAQQKLGLAVAVLAVVVCVVTIFFLADSVRKEIDALASANSDTTQWSLAQTEVDLLALQVVLQAATAEEGVDLADVRRRFDILYSRVRTLAESRQFSDLREDPEARTELASLTGFLDAKVAVIDGPDDELLAALPGIEAEVEDLRSVVRAFSLLGVKLFASDADERRGTIAAILSRIGFLTLALVTTLFLAVFVLVGMIRKSARAERAAADSRNRLQRVISTSIDGILVVGRDGRIIDYNGAAERIFGYSRDEAVGLDMAEAIVPDHMRHAHNTGMIRYRTTGERRVIGSGLLRLEAKRKDGTVFPADVVVSSVETDGEEVFVSYIRDVSEQVSAEQELVETRDKAVAGEKAKAELLAVMSHEMRTPLNGLLGTMELMDDTELTSPQRKYLSAMETSASLLLHHVNDVLSISRADAGQLNLKNSEIEPARLLGELVESQRRSIESHDNTIRYLVSEQPERIWADNVRLKQVILNLVGNANKFTRGGEIVVEFEGLPDGSTVEFRVIDNGIGIQETDRDAIFEDFKTLDASYGRAAEGTGLGLSISRRLVEAMGGQIGVESEAGEGSLFWIRLPIGAPSPKTARSRDAQRKPADWLYPAKGLRILLVEDNRINRLVARAMLEKSGHKVTEAYDGREGIHFAGQMQYDVILMDISMPEVDGITATETIRGEEGPNRATPIIALTAHALPGDLERFRAAGVTETLVKPLTRDALERVLDAGLAPAEAVESETADIIADFREQLGPEQTIALLDQFIRENDELVDRLDDNSRDREARRELAEMVHKSAGSAAVYQTTQLAECLRSLETVLREDDPDKLPAAIKAYLKAWARTSAELKVCRGSLVEKA